MCHLTIFARHAQPTCWRGEDVGRGTSCLSYTIKGWSVTGAGGHEGRNGPSPAVLLVLPSFYKIAPFGCNRDIVFIRSSSVSRFLYQIGGGFISIHDGNTTTRTTGNSMLSHKSQQSYQKLVPKQHHSTTVRRRTGTSRVTNFPPCQESGVKPG